MAKATRCTAGGEEPEPSVTAADTGNAHATGAATAISGVVHTLNIQQRVPPKPVSWPHQVGVIPSPARSFQHRAEVDRLRAAVQGGGRAVLPQVLTGMGGVGKTQLAADYARTAWADGGLDVLVWVTASARSPVVAAYAQAGAELCRADPDAPEQAAKKFLAWLAPKSGQRPCRWLIVLDDVADPGDLIVHPDNPGDPGGRYGLWPPASPYGRTLITTRRRDAALFGEGRRRVEVGLFTPAESVAYLASALAAQGRTEPADQLAALAGELGHLPLALAQAAAYLVDSGETTAAYCRLLADRATKLTDLAPDSLPDEQAAALAAAWSLSVERADSLRPAGLARPVLRLASLLDANGIPQDVLTGETARAYVSEPDPDPGPARRRKGRRAWWRGGRRRPGPPVTAEDAFGALRALDRLSLVDHQPDIPHQAVRVHQLVQRATRDTLTPDQRERAARTAADALMAAWPEVERDTDLVQALRANTAALTSIAEDTLYRPAPHPLLFHIGGSLGTGGQVSAARDHFDRLAAATARRLGADHPSTLDTRRYFARWQAIAGGPRDAVVAFRRVLADTERLLGPDHPDTLDARIHLAYWQGELGDATGAVIAFTALQADCRRLLGPDHLHTLHSRKILAQWQGMTGDAVGAAVTLTELLADCRRVLGPDHEHTLITYSHLAQWRSIAGGPGGDIAMFERVLADFERVLGPRHTYTLVARSHLVRHRAQDGETAGVFHQILADWQQTLGPDHADFLEGREDITVLYGLAGHAVGATAALTELLASFERVLGPDHPDTVKVRGLLARWRGDGQP
ncbi:tetratricopeptide repeat protein [Streptomyces sp. NPDC006798]|uniref:tetratricopeptide repeat protein n=1 Tax=Streptomyces sp. NPDC006798 TaxID=3155462 RepID=UPI0033E67F7D